MVESGRGRVSIAIGIATRGRSAILHETLRYLALQTRPADRIIIAAPAASDVGNLEQLPLRPAVIHASLGLTKQRNALLDAAKDWDVLIFFDDDFFPAPSYLAQVERIFAQDDDVALATGHVIADGIIGPGLSLEEARAALAGDQGAAPGEPDSEQAYNGYGCNFAVRMKAVRASGVEFDEGLPLYGWLEDVDFSRRLAAQGRIVRSAAMRGVHLGVKSARQTGLRLGYSQVANPLYLMRKGSFSADRAFLQMGRNVAMNIIRYPRPEPYVDRRGRLRGNLAALKDLACGRLHPERVLSL